MMWDCGQGSFTQFFNHFGNRTNEKLLKTKVLFITHCHSDHMLGVMQFISKRNILKKEIGFDKLYLIIPSNMIPWYEKYCELI